MIAYPMNMVTDTLNEICKKFMLTKNIVIKKVKYIAKKRHYLVTLADGSLHIVMQELINQHIESLGDRGGLEIAGNLLHSVELEESAPPELGLTTDEYWDGDIQDARDYLDKKEEKEEEGEDK